MSDPEPCCELNWAASAKQRRIASLAASRTGKSVWFEPLTVAQRQQQPSQKAVNRNSDQLFGFAFGHFRG
jgi:hypothetical protein